MCVCVHLCACIFCSLRWPACFLGQRGAFKKEVCSDLSNSSVSGVSACDGGAEGPAGPRLVCKCLEDLSLVQPGN